MSQTEEPEGAMASASIEIYIQICIWRLHGII